jgi:hypothetical protein
MRRRAALISILLLGAVGAIGAAPVAAQVPDPPSPPEIPKPDKPPKPPKPPKPDEPPIVPEPPSTPTEPKPPTEPPPGGEEPPEDDGSTGAGGGSSGGGPGAEPRASQPSEGSSVPAAGLLRAVSALREGGAEASRAPARPEPTASAAPAAGDGWVDRVAGSVLSSLEADASSPRSKAAVEDGDSGGAGGLALAFFAAGLVLVAIGLAVGAARARGATEWHPPGSRPDSM